MEGKQKKERVQVEFTPDQLSKVDGLVGKNDAHTRAQVVKAAIKTKNKLLTAIEGAKTVEIRDKNGKVVYLGPAEFIR